MIYDFWGIGIDESGELFLLDNKRYYQCMKINTLNHLRMHRIIASMSVLGFRKYAINLCHFIKDTNEGFAYLIRIKYLS